MGTFLFEEGAGHDDCPECGKYVPNRDEEYVTTEGEVKRVEIWSCPHCGDVTKDEQYPIESDDDRKYIWSAFLAAKRAGVVGADVQRPVNPV